MHLSHSLNAAKQETFLTIPIMLQIILTNYLNFPPGRPPAGIE